MKEHFFLMALFVLSIANGYSQEFNEDFESYDPGQPTTAAWWADPIICGGSGGIDDSQCGVVGNGGEAAEGVFDLGNKIFGLWHLRFYMYVPSGKEGYWNLQGIVPVTSGEWIVGNIFLNQDLASPGVGLIDNCFGAPVNFNFPHDQWFPIAMSFDMEPGISVATWSMHVDGEEVIAEGTPFTDSIGTIPTSLGGVSYYQLSDDTLFYLENICYQADDPCDLLNTGDFQEVKFNIGPNPVKDRLYVEADRPIDALTIYNILGQQVYNKSALSDSFSIDVSGWSAGTYVLEASVNGQKQTIKLVK